MVKSFIKFQYADTTLSLKGKRMIQQYILAMFKENGFPNCHIHYIFCTDAYLLSINQSFLDHDDYTDIITFDLSEPNTGIMEAEIYISLDRIKANALSFNCSFEDELLRVLFHGALHLFGFADKDAKSKKKMTEMEDYYLEEYKKR